MTASLRERLGAAVGADHVQDSTLLSDVTGRGGAPACVVSPATEGEIASVVRICRESRLALVPAGCRTAYWSPLSLQGVVLLETRRLEGLQWRGSVAIAGAGLPVRTLDRALRERGGHLPIHPDAFGETPVGAMVATACTSGIGMGLGGIGGAISGVEVVTGRAEPMWTGAGAHAGLPPFMREGLPDLTGIFLGSEGGLGIVTKVAFPFRAAPWRVHISGQIAPHVALRLGRAFAGIYDTFRVVATFEPGRAPVSASGADAEQKYPFDLWIVSPFSASEAVARAVESRRALERAGAAEVNVRGESAKARAGRDPDYGDRWAGQIGGHEMFCRSARLAGIDVNVAYDDAAACSDDLMVLCGDFARRGVVVRQAWYLAPDFVNIGVHATIPHGSDQWTEAESAAWHQRLAAHPIVPYRLGRRWPATYLEGLGVGRAALASIKGYFDPDGILQPGLPLWT